MTKNLYAEPLREEDDSERPKNYEHPKKLKNAIDFLCNEGTKIFAAAEGEIVKVINHKTKTTNDPDDAGNNILIKHEHREFSHYAHFKYNGIKVKKGDNVREGDFLGYSGNTGFSYAPHLHFSIITRENKTRPLSLSNFKTVPISWKNG